MPRRIRIALFGDGHVGRQHESSKTYPLLPEFKVAYHYIEDIYFFEVNTKYIASSVLKTSEFS